MEEQKRIVINPLKEKPKEKSKERTSPSNEVLSLLKEMTKKNAGPGRPTKPKVKPQTATKGKEKHVMTNKRIAALVKAREVRAQKVLERKLKKAQSIVEKRNMQREKEIKNEANKVIIKTQSATIDNLTSKIVDMESRLSGLMGRLDKMENKPKSGEAQSQDNLPQVPYENRLTDQKFTRPTSMQLRNGGVSYEEGAKPAEPYQMEGSLQINPPRVGTSTSNIGSFYIG